MDGSSPTEFSSLLTLTTASVGEIKENQGQIVVHYGNGVIKFPSKVTFEDTDWRLNCFCSPNVLGALREWRRQIMDQKTERMGLPSEYMRTVYFLKYDGQGNCRDAIKCPGTWIGALGNGEMNQEGGNIVQVNVPFVISKAIYLTGNELRTI